MSDQVEKLSLKGEKKMANMAAKVTADYLEEKGFHYEIRGNSEEIVRVSYKMDNRESLEVLIMFDDDETSVQLLSPCYVKVPESKKDIIYELCNRMNCTYRWVKYSLDERDNTIDIRLDSMLPKDFDGELVVDYSMRMANIADEAYPEFMKAIWA